MVDVDNLLLCPIPPQYKHRQFARCLWFVALVNDPQERFYFLASIFINLYYSGIIIYNYVRCLRMALLACMHKSSPSLSVIFVVNNNIAQITEYHVIPLGSQPPLVILDLHGKSKVNHSHHCAPRGRIDSLMLLHSKEYQMCGEEHLLCNLRQGNLLSQPLSLVDRTSYIHILKSIVSEVSNWLEVFLCFLLPYASNCVCIVAKTHYSNFFYYPLRKNTFNLMSIYV